MRKLLKQEIHKKYKCVIISLYGRNNIEELNTAVYTKFRVKNFFHKLPKFLSSIGFLTVTGLFYQVYKDFIYPIYKCFFDLGLLIIIAWFVVTFFLSWWYFKSIEFENTVSIDDIKKIRKLKKSLIVLEDVERTKIDIVDLFGWVNSLCDINGNDGAKILLVVNEDKLKEKLEEKQKEIYKEEKAVMNTIQFESDFKQTVYSIFENKFRKNKYFKPLIKALDDIYKDNNTNINNISELINEIEKCLISAVTTLDAKYCLVKDTLSIFNYRNFIERFQYLNSILKKLQSSGEIISSEYIKNTVILFACVAHNDMAPGAFIYRFSIERLFAFPKYAKIFEDLNKLKLKHSKGFLTSTFSYDDDAKVIYSPYYHTDKELNKAIDSILERLNKPDVDEVSSYLSIMHYLTRIRYDYKFENDKIDKIKEKMLNNVSTHLDIVKSHVKNIGFNELAWYHSRSENISNENGKKYFEQFRDEFFKSFHEAYDLSCFEKLINEIVKLSDVSSEYILLLNFSVMTKYILSFDVATLFNLQVIVSRFKETCKKGITNAKIVIDSLRNMAQYLSDLVDPAKEYKCVNGIYRRITIEVYQRTNLDLLQWDIREIINLIDA